MVLVQSECAAIARRQAVRHTWGRGLSGHVIFVVDCCLGGPACAPSCALPERAVHAAAKAAGASAAIALAARPPASALGTALGQLDDVLSLPAASLKRRAWLGAAYRWALAHTNATWLLDAADDSYVPQPRALPPQSRAEPPTPPLSTAQLHSREPSELSPSPFHSSALASPPFALPLMPRYVYPAALLAHLHALSTRGHALQPDEILSCAGGGCAGGVWTPWHATTSVVGRAVAEAVSSSTHSDASRSAWTRYRDEMVSWRRRGASSFLKGLLGVRAAPTPPPLLASMAAVGRGGREHAAGGPARSRGSAQFHAKRACTLHNPSEPTLVIRHVLGSRSGKQAHANLYWCHALDQPGVLAGTVDAPRHLPHTHAAKVQLFATNPSALSEDVYLLRLTSYSHCSATKDMTYLRQFEYERNSVTAFMSKSHEKPLQSFTHSEDARALLVGDKAYVLYNSWNGSSKVNSMVLRRYRWPSLELVAPPVRLRLPSARKREKNWSPFVAAAVAPSAGGGGPSRGSPRLYLTYQLEPHVVLSCRAHDGQCRVRYNTSALALWRARVPELGRLKVSGGTPCVTLNGAPTCMAHYRAFEPAPSRPMRTPAVAPRPGPYMHMWYALNPAPPFQVMAVSRPFRFAALFGDDRDRVQYASGLVGNADGSRLTVSFGVGDCLAAELRVSSADVLRLLTGDPDVSVMSRRQAWSSDYRH